MTTPIRVVAAVALALRVGAAVRGCNALVEAGHLPKEGPRFDALRADLRERVRPGVSRAVAEEWFLSHGFAPRVIQDPTRGRPAGFSVTVPNDSHLDHAEIRIQVYFDADGVVREVYADRFVYCL